MESSSNIESINSAINSLYTSFIESFDSESLKSLDILAFIDSKIIDNNFFSFLLGHQSESILYIVNSFMLAYLIYYGVTYFFSHFSGNQVESPFQFLIKFIICAICVNSSYFICSQIINIISLISDYIKLISIIPNINALSFYYLHKEISGVFLVYNNSSLNLFSFNGFLYLFSTMGFFNLLITYSYRYILIKLLILLSPFFILSASLNSTRWLFKMWLKNFISLLCIQIVVLLLMLVFSNLELGVSDTTTKLLYIASLLAIQKASSFVKDFSSGFTTDITSGISSIKSIFY